ncbi:hypothetical protein Tco_1391819 [Tanacetum coccineum]
MSPYPQQSEDGIVQAGSGVAGLSSVEVSTKLCRKFDFACLLTDLLKMIRIEEVEEELEAESEARIAKAPDAPNGVGGRKVVVTVWRPDK